MTGFGATFVYLVIGFALLVKGADWLVTGGAEVARRMGISTLVVGLTVVAWGTSAPEVVVSGLAAWNGEEAMSLGNVLGSNVANLGLVLGACGLVLAAILQKPLGGREIFWLFAAIVALYAVAYDGTIDRGEGAILLTVFGVHNLHILKTARGYVDEGIEDRGVGRPYLRLVVGTLAMAGGARAVVEGGVRLAEQFDVPGHVVGLTVFALGTSLPELAAGLAGAFRKETDISLGNVVGSNVFNLLVVVGLVALIRPFEVAGGGRHPSVDLAVTRDLPVVLGFSVAAVVLTLIRSQKGGGWRGALLFVGYVVYVGSLFVE